MSKHLTGSKRLAVIQRWINGHDDPDWEVLPTRKQGKYIVKKRETPIEEEKEEKTPENEENEVFEEEEEKPKMQKQKSKKLTKSQEIDPMINLEILNQLKLLGDEIKRKREKKEQKRLIEEVISKKTPAPKQAPPPPPPIQEEEYYESPIPRQRRNRIFDDIY